ncbi:MAG: hypothetical protein BMS9Abin12_0583 [Acidimicrobiia bacterium]|nr:MAG: hypothetical protein BMS9Abin12_0583 [Acidimicrobiia bacterium]
MIIDCGTCDMRETKVCDDCVVSALVRDAGILELAEVERAAIDSMSKVGLVPPIRLVSDNGNSVAGGT